jgi:hypothetical protein
MATKKDNHNPRAKLELRRYFLRKYHDDGQPIHVLDCCQGSGVLWGTLRAEFPVASYWGVDLKPKKGRIKLDSVRVLQQPGWPQNVVDVDTYGSPWKHWAAILGNLLRPITVFLTIGQWQMGTDRLILSALGLGRLKVPPGIAIKLHGLGLQYLLGQAGAWIVEAIEAISDGSARYIGLRLEPTNSMVLKDSPPPSVGGKKLRRKALHHARLSS